jgi:AraC-like DNA-binding protein
MVASPSELPAEAAEKVLELAETRGIGRAELLQAAGLPPAFGSISFENLCRLYEEGARLTRDESFGLHVGERTSPRMYGMLGYAAANSRTFGDALAKLIELQALWSDAAGLQLRRQGRAAVVAYWHRGSVPAEVRRHESEQMMAALMSFAIQVLEAPVRPIELRFEHSAPADLTEHDRIFQAPLVFGAPATELVLASGLLSAQLVEPDLVLGDLMEAQARTILTERMPRGGFMEDLRSRIAAGILAGEAVSLSASAVPLGIGPRTLQRRLRERGMTFRNMADDVRLDLARKMLADPNIALAEIAHRLGYSQPSAFHRAFRRATATTPRLFRLGIRNGRGSS